jgi:aspartate 1-decarboxylase
MIGEGDLVIVLAYDTVPEEDARDWRPRLVYVDGANRIKRVGSERLEATLT